MTREQWLKQEIEQIKQGDNMRQRCVMAVPDRERLGLCLGDIPEERSKRGAYTCSPECQADRRRLLRWQQAHSKCRLCGRGLSKKQKLKLKAAGGDYAAIRVYVSGRDEETCPASD